MSQIALLAAKDIVSRLGGHGVDVNGSVNRQVQGIMRSDDQMKHHWDVKVADLAGISIETSTWFESRTLYGYIVQIAMTHHQSGYADVGLDVVVAAARKAKVHVDVSYLNPARVEVEVGAEEVPVEVERPRRSKHGKRGSGGSKKERAIVLYVQAQKDGLSGRQVIDLFKEQLDLSEAGARTYEYNLRKELWK